MAAKTKVEITLEKIELVKNRTGASYAQAKEALEGAKGDVVDAIIALEETMGSDFQNIDGKDWRESKIYLKAKEIVEKGNISRIIVKKGDSQIVNFPLTVGVVGTVLVPWISIVGIVAAIGTQCQLEFVDDKGVVTDINGKVIGAYDKTKDVTLKGIDKAQELINKGIDKANEYGITEKVEEIIDKVEEVGSKIINNKEKE